MGVEKDTPFFSFQEIKEYALAVDININSKYVKLS